jgi:hypothetical protein
MLTPLAKKKIEGFFVRKIEIITTPTMSIKKSNVKSCMK